jgi:hypothetical protein
MRESRLAAALGAMGLPCRLRLRYRASARLMCSRFRFRGMVYPLPYR